MVGMLPIKFQLQNESNRDGKHDKIGEKSSFIQLLHVQLTFFVFPWVHHQFHKVIYM